VFIHHLETQLQRCHFKPQLKECHVFSLYPEPQLKEHSSKTIFKVSPKHCRPRTSKQTSSCFALSSVAASEPPNEIQFQTAWQSPFVAKDHTSLKSLVSHVSPNGTNFAAKRPKLLWPSGIVATAWRFALTTRRYTSNANLLVFSPT